MENETGSFTTDPPAEGLGLPADPLTLASPRGRAGRRHQPHPLPPPTAISSSENANEAAETFYPLDLPCTIRFARRLAGPRLQHPSRASAFGVAFHATHTTHARRAVTRKFPENSHELPQLAAAAACEAAKPFRPPSSKTFHGRPRR
jgi:hypothetical protein